jgi:hypothetical protein
MTPAQALQMMDQAVSTMNLDRTQHANLQQATQVLAQAIQPAPAPVPVPVVKDANTDKETKKEE